MLLCRERFIADEKKARSATERERSFSRSRQAENPSKLPRIGDATPVAAGDKEELEEGGTTGDEEEEEEEGEKSGGGGGVGARSMDRHGEWGAVLPHIPKEASSTYTHACGVRVTFLEHVASLHLNISVLPNAPRSASRNVARVAKRDAEAFFSSLQYSEGQSEN